MKQTANAVHLAKADQFYDTKRAAKMRVRADSTLAICMDFQKILPAPNVTTNDVYYKRQLTCISFNIHELATGKSHFYVYDQTVAKKGSDDLCSMLDHFINNTVDADVRHLEIFCDSCAGQDKNHSVIRYLHYPTHVK